MKKVSKLFQPLLVIPKNANVKNQDLTCKSHRLMLEMGLIRPADNGMYTILPLLQRSLEKLTRLIDATMEEIGAQKLTLPTLTASQLWKTSGRFTQTSELLTVKDRHSKEFILSPTHEEAITAMLSAVSPITYRSLPLKLYQISSKFRDELKPRFGLLRTKEFLMKDLYSFDVSMDAARQTYEEVNEGYRMLFERIGIPAHKIGADAGIMGGNLSHEYHFLADIGEDLITRCLDCGFCSNEGRACTKCGSTNLKQSQGIEVAHAFILGEKYSEPLKATFLHSNGKPAPMVMGCYGIGVTRLIAAALEVKSKEEELRWPSILAPFKCCFIPPKSGSKEESQTMELVATIERDLDLMDCVIDDRPLTIGKRLYEAKRLGYPFIVIIGGKAVESPPKIELHHLETDLVTYLEPSELLKFLTDNS